MPCPHHDIKIIQRSNHQSAVASAAYQSGERLFSEYDQKQKYYSHKSEIVHTEIMLPPHAPPAYADRNTLWNAAEAMEERAVLIVDYGKEVSNLERRMAELAAQDTAGRRTDHTRSSPAPEH